MLLTGMQRGCWMLLKCKQNNEADCYIQMEGPRHRGKKSCLHYDNAPDKGQQPWNHPLAVYCYKLRAGRSKTPELTSAELLLKAKMQYFNIGMLFTLADLSDWKRSRSSVAAFLCSAFGSQKWKECTAAVCSSQKECSAVLP